MPTFIGNLHITLCLLFSVGLRPMSLSSLEVCLKRF